jgi:hypothetical protein
MATQAYDKVLQLDKTNATAKAKLASINGAISTTGKPAAAAPASPAKPAAPTKGALQQPEGSAAIPAGSVVLAPVASTR